MFGLSRKLAKLKEAFDASVASEPQGEKKKAKQTGREKAGVDNKCQYCRAAKVSWLAFCPECGARYPETEEDDIVDAPGEPFSPIRDWYRDFKELPPNKVAFRSILGILFFPVVMPYFAYLLTRQAKWYNSESVVYTQLFLCFPFGFYSMYYNETMNRKKKLAIAAFTAVLFIIALSSK
jgi:hypothetical protein